jgi:hypothetical protein
LRKGALGDGPDNSSLIAQATEEVVKFALEAFDEALGKTDLQHGDGQCAASGEIGWILAMGCKQLIRSEHCRCFGE